MRNLALLFVAVASVFAFTALTRPPVEDVVLAGSLPKCGSDICLGGGSENSRVRVQGGLTLEGRSEHNDGGKTLTFSNRGTLVYDFPSLSGPTITSTTVCADSSAGTATGCTFGDTVTLGIDQVPVNAFGTISAYISAADSFKVRACAVGITDGGSFNMPDASYTVRCFR